MELDSLSGRKARSSADRPLTAGCTESRTRWKASSSRSELVIGVLPSDLRACRPGRGVLLGAYPPERFLRLAGVPSPHPPASVDGATLGIRRSAFQCVGDRADRLPAPPGRHR